MIQSVHPLVQVRPNEHKLDENQIRRTEEETIDWLPLEINLSLAQGIEEMEMMIKSGCCLVTQFCFWERVLLYTYLHLNGNIQTIRLDWLIYDMHILTYKSIVG